MNDLHEAGIPWRLGPIYYMAHSTGAHNLNLPIPILSWQIVLCLKPQSRLWKRAARSYGWRTP